MNQPPPPNPSPWGPPTTARWPTASDRQRVATSPTAVPCTAVPPTERRGAQPPTGRLPGDRPVPTPKWWLLVAFGIVAGIAPFVPFTTGSDGYAASFWDAFPMVVLAAAAALAGVAARNGYPAALAFAAGVLAVYGVAMVLVLWLVVSIVRWAQEYDTSIGLGPGAVLSVVSAILGLIAIFPGIAAALRPASRTAHPLIGLAGATGVGLLVAGLLQPDEFGAGPFDSDTASDVFLALFISAPIAVGLLALLARTAAAHAFLCGTMLFPFATVLAAAFADGPTGLHPLVAWGVIVAGVASTTGAATAADRHVARGRRRVAIPAHGLAVGLVGSVTFVVGGVVALAIGDDSIGDDSIGSYYDEDGDDDGDGASLGGATSSGGQLSIGGSRDGYVGAGGTTTFEIVGSGRMVTIYVEGDGSLDPTLQVTDRFGSELAYDDDTYDYDPEVTVWLESGERYDVAVGAFGSTSGDFTVHAY